MMKIVLNVDQLNRLSTILLDNMFVDVKVLNHKSIPNDPIEKSIRFETPYIFVRPGNEVIMIVQGRNKMTLYVRRELLKEMDLFLPILQYENKVFLELLSTFVKNNFNINFDDIVINDMVINHVEDYLKNPEDYI